MSANKTRSGFALSQMALLAFLTLWVAQPQFAQAQQTTKTAAVVVQPQPQPSKTDELADETEARREAEHRAAIAEAKSELTSAAVSRLENWIGLYGILIAVIAIIGGFMTRSQALEAKEEAQQAANVAGLEAAKAAKLEMLSFRAEARAMVDEITARRSEADEITESLRTLLDTPPSEKQNQQPSESDSQELSQRVEEISNRPRTTWTARDYRLLLLDASLRNDWQHYFELASAMAWNFAGQPHDLAFGLFAKAFSAGELGDVVEATQVYEEYFTRCPDDDVERKSSAYSNWGNDLSKLARSKTASDPAEAEKLWSLADEKYAAALAIKPNMYDALSNWGNALSARANAIVNSNPIAAKRLWTLASKKYAAAIAANPRKHEALNNWGALLIYRAQAAAEPAKASLLQASEKKLLLAEKIRPGSGSYNLACIAGLRGNAVDAAKWLRFAKATATKIPDCIAIAADPDFESVRNSPEFQQALIDIGCAPAAKG